jgi:VanZ family protein
MWRSIVFGVIILILCLIPSEQLHKIDFLKINYQDLAVHLIMFCLFAVILTLDFRRTRLLQNRIPYQIYLLLFIAVMFSSFTEFLQFAFPSLNRTANLGDLLFDITGSSIGLVIVRFIK